MKELARKAWKYTLFQKENGELVLSVMVGTILQIDYKYLLTQKEKNIFEKEGIVFLEKLVRDIQTYPSRYEFRRLENLEGSP